VGESVERVSVKKMKAAHALKIRACHDERCNLIDNFLSLDAGIVVECPDVR
jgi:hypothetical protein